MPLKSASARHKRSQKKRAAAVLCRAALSFISVKGEHPKRVGYLHSIAHALSSGIADKNSECCLIGLCESQTLKWHTNCLDKWRRSILMKQSIPITLVMMGALLGGGCAT